RSKESPPKEIHRQQADMISIHQGTLQDDEFLTREIPAESERQMENDEDDDDDYGVIAYDDDESALARIERALVAPIQLIGSIDGLQPGSTLHTVDSKTQRS